MVRLKSMKTRLAKWFLVVALVPLAATAALTYFQQVRTIKENAFDKLSAVRDLKVRELTNWIEDREGDLRTASGDYEIRRLGGPLHSEIRSFEQEATIVAVRELFRRYLANYSAFSEMFLVDARSERIAISTDPSREGADCRENPYFTTPLKTGDLFFKDIYWSETLDRPAADFSIPVFCLEHGGEHLIGVLVARVDLERSLYRLLQENTGMGQTGETLIVNPDDMALSELLYYENAPLRMKIRAQPAVLAVGGKTGIIEVEDYRGVKVLAAYAHIPATGWGFVAKQDQAEVYAPIATLTRFLGVAVAASIFLVLLITFFLTRSITSPVLAMAGVAGRIQSGDLEARCSAVGTDEIASLGNSLNMMADTLQAEGEIRQGVAGLTEVLVSAVTVESLAAGLLGGLIETTPTHLACFFRRSSDGKGFDLIHSIGAGTRNFADFERNYPEGQLGLALAARKISHLKDIPEDTVFTYRTIAGDAVPREMVAIPLVVRGRTEAVIALASLGEYSVEHMRILETIQPGIGTALANVLAVEKTEQTVEVLEEANVELQSQSDELLEQTEELKQLAEELRSQKRQVEEAGRLKSQFLSNMSHELRTPLNSVLALSQLMISRGVGVEPEQDGEYLKIIERNGRQLLDLINDVLDLSKIEAGHVHLQLSDFAAEGVVRMAMETSRPLAGAKDLALKISLGDDLPEMHSDQDKVRRILLNLLSNAVKFTDSGSVSLAVRAVGGRLSFEVRDTGIGIEADELPHIFDEFRQVDGSPTRRFGGTGLGLAISRHLAGLLGGEISVTSRVGEGSTFTLMLPPKCPDGTALPSADAEQGVSIIDAVPEGGGGRRILVVDDDAVVALQLRTFLEGAGYEVLAAAGGREALIAMKMEAPDAIVLDLTMPEVSGFDVLNEMRSDPGVADIPVLVLTARELTREDLAELEHNGIRQLVQKGTVGRTQLLTYVRALFAPVRRDERARSTREGPILVVEDNPDNMLTITAIIEQAGHSFITAGDGEEAIRLCREKAPSLILMDMNLPVMGGIEATRRIKADEDLKDIPVFALTASAMAGDRERFMAAGCDAYFDKPVDGRRLIEVLDTWIGPGDLGSGQGET